MNIGKAVRTIRTAKCLSQKDVAEALGISQSHLSLMESDARNMRVSQLLKISMAVGVPASIILFLAADDAEMAMLSKELKEKMSEMISELLSKTPA